MTGFKLHDPSSYSHHTSHHNWQQVVPQVSWRPTPRSSFAPAGVEGAGGGTSRRQQEGLRETAHHDQHLVRLKLIPRRFYWFLITCFIVTRFGIAWNGSSLWQSSESHLRYFLLVKVWVFGFGETIRTPSVHFHPRVVEAIHHLGAIACCTLGSALFNRFAEWL